MENRVHLWEKLEKYQSNLAQKSYPSEWLSPIPRHTMQSSETTGSTRPRRRSISTHRRWSSRATETSTVYHWIFDEDSYQGSSNDRSLMNQIATWKKGTLISTRFKKQTWSFQKTTEY